MAVLALGMKREVSINGHLNKVKRQNRQKNWELRKFETTDTP